MKTPDEEALCVLRQIASRIAIPLASTGASSRSSSVCSLSRDTRVYGYMLHKPQFKLQGARSCPRRPSLSQRHQRPTCRIVRLLAPRRPPKTRWMTTNIFVQSVSRPLLDSKPLTMYPSLASSANASHPHVSWPQRGSLSTLALYI